MNDKLIDLGGLSGYYFVVGILQDKAARIQVGLTNADILFINENGSPTRHIPPRPVLDMTIRKIQTDFSNGLFDKIAELYVKENFNVKPVEKFLKQYAIQVQNFARDIIKSNDGRLEANAPSTIRRKGENYPLHDTGQLSRSIVCKLMKNGNFV